MSLLQAGAKPDEWPGILRIAGVTAGAAGVTALEELPQDDLTFLVGHRVDHCKDCDDTDINQLFKSLVSAARHAQKYMAVSNMSMGWADGVDLSVGSIVREFKDNWCLDFIFLYSFASMLFYIYNSLC